MPSWSIVEPPPPTSADDPWVRALAAAADTVNRAAWGTDDLRRTPAELLEVVRDDAYTRHVAFVAAPGTAGPETGPDGLPVVLGYALLHLPLSDNTHLGLVVLGVLPEHRRQGLGRALHEAVVRRARAEGRTHLTVATDQAVEPPPGDGTLAPPTGEGRVGLADPAVRFARAHGWDLEQVARFSVLDVPRADDDAAWSRVAALRADAERHAGPDYRLVSWSGPTPERWAAQFADLQAQMSADEPSGGFVHDADVWDVERLRRAEERHASQGRVMLVMAAEHVPTGTIAAYTSVVVPDQPREFLHQFDTLVQRDHRGRRLGMLVKTANLRRIADELPAIRRIGTWNAQENGWMLAINVALGFRPAGGSGAWQLRLD